MKSSCLVAGIKGGESRARVQSPSSGSEWMVACAALSTLQPPNHLAASMAAVAQTVEDIKQRLTAAVEKDDQTLCESLLNEVRPLVTTREILEETRIGFIVNQLRRQYFKKWPTLLRISREVIKSWSEIVCDEVKRPQSGASSRNTTPNGITPNTPAGRRVTSTGLQGSQGRLVSPANGSYAPRSQVSPGEATPTAAANGIHKSASVGGDLLKHASGALSAKPITPKENGKRKATDDGTAPSMKRTKTVAGSLSVSVTPGTPTTAAPSQQTPPTTSVLAQRQAVQSTSELFAQMSQTLPGHIDIGTDIREHEEKVKREMKDEELAHSLQASASFVNVPLERKKRKYERKSQKGTAPGTPAAVASPMLQTLSVTPSSLSSNANEERLPSLVFRFPKNGLTSTASTPTVSTISPDDNATSSKRKYEKSIRSIARPTTPPPTVVARKAEKEKEKEREREKERREAIERKAKEEQEQEEEEDYVEEEKPKPVLSKLKDWKSLIPSMEELRLRAELAEKETKKVVEATAVETKKDPTKVQLVKNFRRPILILPYLENPTGPDFLLHKYPNRLQYYSEDNFRFGEKRPTE
ncbi:unnamed protein product [Caenorhabditis sp. 36 PRJEB53466]|nr:unnamed protein product [Caenorhabditis sp. 36 PRJEB53466]